MNALRRYGRQITGVGQQQFVLCRDGVNSLLDDRKEGFVASYPRDRGLVEVTGPKLVWKCVQEGVGSFASGWCCQFACLSGSL